MRIDLVPPRPLSLLAAVLAASACTSDGDPAAASARTALVTAADPTPLVFSEFPAELPEHATELASNAARGVAYDATLGRLYVVHPYGLSISDDGGDSFRHVALAGIANDHSYDALPDVFAAGGRVYVQSQRGWDISLDGGSSWTHRNADHLDSVYAFSGTDFWAFTHNSGSYNDLERSRDGGATWERLPSPPTIEALCAEGDTLVAPAGSAVFYSRDAGESWSKVDGVRGWRFPDMRSCALANGVAYFRDERTGMVRLDLAAEQPSFAWLGEIFSGRNQYNTSFGKLAALGDSVAWVDDIYGDIAAVSRDRGNSWTPIALDRTHESAHWHGVALAADRMFVAGDSRGLDVLRDGAGTWQLRAASHPFGGITAFGALGHDTTFWAWSGTDVFRSDDAGVSWTRQAAPWSASDVAHPETGYEEQGLLVLGHNDNAWVSRDRGLTWEAPHAHGGRVEKFFSIGDDLIMYAPGSSGALSAYSRAQHAWRAIATDDSLVGVAADGARLYALYAGSMKISDDGGRSFGAAQPLPVAPGPSGQYVSGPALAFYGDQAVFFGDGQFSTSSDHGLSWSAAAKRSGAQSSESLALRRNLVVDEAGYPFGRSVSTDLGATFTPVPAASFDAITILTDERVCFVDGSASAALVCAATPAP